MIEIKNNVPVKLPETVSPTRAVPPADPHAAASQRSDLAGHAGFFDGWSASGYDASTRDGKVTLGEMYQGVKQGFQVGAAQAGVFSLITDIFRAPPTGLGSMIDGKNGELFDVDLSRIQHGEFSSASGTYDAAGNASAEARRAFMQRMDPKGTGWVTLETLHAATQEDAKKAANAFFDTHPALRSMQSVLEPALEKVNYVKSVAGWDFLVQLAGGPGPDGKPGIKTDLMDSMHRPSGFYEIALAKGSLKESQLPPEILAAIEKQRAEGAK